MFETYGDYVYKDLCTVRPAVRIRIQETVPEKQAISPVIGMNILDQMEEIENHARMWKEWNAASAPQTIDQFPDFPAFVLRVYEELSKLSFSLDQQGNSFTFRSNIGDMFPEDQYEVLILCQDQQIRNNSEWVKPTSVDSDSVSFTCPEGFSFSNLEFRIDYFMNNCTESLIIDISPKGQQLDFYSVYLLLSEYPDFEITYQTNTLLQTELDELLAITILDEGNQIDFQYNLAGELTIFSKP